MSRWQRTELWSNYPWDGGTVLADIPWVTLRRRAAIRGVLVARSLQGTINQSWDEAGEVIAGRVLKHLYQDGSVLWFRITEREDGVRTGGRIRIEAEGPESDLQRTSAYLHTYVDGAATFSFPTASKTLANHLTDEVLPHLPGTWAVGTVASSTAITTEYADDTPLSAALKLVVVLNRADESALVLSVRPAAADAGLLLDVTDFGAAEDVVELRPGTNIQRLSRTQHIHQLTNRVFVVGQDGKGPGRAYWRIKTIVSATQFDIEDLNGSAVPIFLADSPYATPYWFHEDGTSKAVTAIDAALQRLTVASTTGLVVGEWGRLAKNSAGDEFAYIDNPAAQPPIAIGRLQVEGVPSLTNWARNPFLEGWPSTLPDDWTSGSVSGPTKETGVGLWETGGWSAKFSGTSYQRLQSSRGVGQVHVPAGWSVQYAIRLLITAFPYPTTDFLYVADPDTGSQLVFFIDPTQPGLDTLNQWLTFRVDLPVLSAGFKHLILGAFHSVGPFGGSSGGVFYVDRAQILLLPPGVSAPSEWIRGSGAAELHLRGVSYLLRNPGVIESLRVPVLDRYRLDPTGAGEFEKLSLGGTVRTTVPALGVDEDHIIVEEDVDELKRKERVLTLNTRLDRLTELIRPGLGTASLLGFGSGRGVVAPPPAPPPNPATFFTVPSTPLPGARAIFDIRTLMASLVDADPIGTWPDLSGNGLDISNTGTARMTFNADPDGDGIGEAASDGVNDILLRTGMAAYAGGELTMYLVARWTRQGSAANCGLLSLGRASLDDAVAGAMGLTTYQAGFAEVERNSIDFSAVSVSASQNAIYCHSEYTWVVLAISWRMVLGRAVLSIWTNGFGVHTDLGTTLPAWDYTTFALGGRWRGSAGEYQKAGFRYWSIYHLGHRDWEINHQLQFLGHTFRVPTLL